MIEHLLKESVKDFIKEHVQDDAARLPLKYKSIEGAPVKDIVEQIIARQKALKKFPSWAENFNLIFPGITAVEQASSPITAQYKSGLFKGNLAVDLTGGMGIDSLALANRFKKVYCIEADSYKAAVAAHNFNHLGIYNVEVFNTTAEEFLKNASFHADLIYVDPDRRPDAGRVISLEKSLPNVVNLEEQLLSLADNIMIKTSPMLDITATVELFKNVYAVHVISKNNECKELLFLMQKNRNREVTVTAAMYNEEWQKVTTGFPSALSAAVGLPESYIYEPDTAILKAGIQDFVANKYNLKKLHPSTNLYTSEELYQEFTGRIFKLHDILPVNKKALKKALPEMKANLATRNFPEHINKVKNKLQLRDGGKYYLFACRLSNLTYKILLTEKA